MDGSRRDHCYGDHRSAALPAGGGWHERDRAVDEHGLSRRRQGQARIEARSTRTTMRWKPEQGRISSMRYHPQYEGDYARWLDQCRGQTCPSSRFHLTSDETGVPMPPPVGDASLTRHSIAELATRIYRPNDEDAVRNVQNV